MRIFNTACVITALLLTGCASSPPVDTSTSGPTAKLRVTSTTTANVFVKHWTYKNCETGSSSEIAILGRNANLLMGRGTDRRIGIPLIEGLAPTQVSELEIPADRLYYLEMRSPSVASIISGTVTYNWCSRRIKFTPTEGAIYEASFELIRDASDGPCSIILREIKSTSAGSYTRVEFSDYLPAKQTCEQPR